MTSKGVGSHCTTVGRPHLAQAVGSCSGVAVASVRGLAEAFGNSIGFLCSPIVLLMSSYLLIYPCFIFAT